MELINDRVCQIYEVPLRWMTILSENPRHHQTVHTVSRSVKPCSVSYKNVDGRLQIARDPETLKP